MSPQANSVVTLLTDFGDRDYFVASMKGVILGINPQASIVDLSHHVTPHRIDEAAYLLKAAYRYFPDGTVHLAVVDPGVGSDRRSLLVTSTRYFFVAPDNGLLSYVMQEEVGVEVRQIENKQYRLEAQGATFDGRDLFAPCAAWLTRGQQPGSYGRLIREYVRLPDLKPDLQQGILYGRVAYIDRFGNVISNITPYDLREWRGATKRTEAEMMVVIGDARISGLVGCYADGDMARPKALINSNGHVEIFVKEGRAAEHLAVAVGTPVEVRSLGSG